jgi:hypothetical protein
MRVTAACANMSVTASATKFDAVKRLTWATMKLITVCRSVRVQSIVGVGDFVVGVAAIQSNAPRFKRHQQRPHLCVDSKHDDNNKQTALAKFEQQGEGHARVADLRTNAALKLNESTLLFETISRCNVLFICTRRRSFRSSHG